MMRNCCALRPACPARMNFMGRLANGYELKLADRGESLSGGQRQSIAVARAIGGQTVLSCCSMSRPARWTTQTEMSLIERLKGELSDRTGTDHHAQIAAA